MTIERPRSSPRSGCDLKGAAQQTTRGGSRGALCVPGGQGGLQRVFGSCSVQRPGSAGHVPWSSPCIPRDLPARCRMLPAARRASSSPGGWVSRHPTGRAAAGQAAALAVLSGCHGFTAGRAGTTSLI